MRITIHILYWDHEPWATSFPYPIAESDILVTCLRDVSIIKKERSERNGVAGWLIDDDDDDDAIV